MGASYINWNGGKDAHTTGDLEYDNSIDLVQREADGRWMMINLTADRLDRMQRMIRLQRWLDIPFNEVDALVTAAMNAEYGANPSHQITANTLRSLGVYQHLKRHYALPARDYAAFMNYLSLVEHPGQISQFDQVFNNPVLFGTPLQLDYTTFKYPAVNPADQRTVNQLCAGLGLEPDPQSFGLAASATNTHVVPLRRALLVFSSLYRQARIAQMFGLSQNDFHQLLMWLGGADYVATVAQGRILPRREVGNEIADVLDILMQLDWVVSWLGTQKLRVNELSLWLTPVTRQEPPHVLLERLQQLARAAQDDAVSVPAVQALKLPGNAAGATIDWHTALQTHAVIDETGAMLVPQLTVPVSGQQQLSEKVTAMVNSMSLDPAAVAPTITTLVDFLLDSLTRQQRLVEALLQEHTGLLPELALLVGHATEASSQQLLSTASRAWPQGGAQDDEYVNELLIQLGNVTQYSHAVSWMGVGALALRTFLSNPALLGVDEVWPLTLHSLYLLKSYQTLLNTLGQPEGRLLGYLELANTTSAKRLAKRQLAEQAQMCNALMATLLGWSESEVAIFTAKLPEQRARTVAHIDWLRRAQALALQTGLNAATLLKACDLTAESPDADWQAVGQAAMAAVR